jgi:hypothetical protein
MDPNIQRAIWLVSVVWDMSRQSMLTSVPSWSSHADASTRVPVASFGGGFSLVLANAGRCG